MRTTFSKVSPFAILALPFMLSFPAHAQEVREMTTTTTTGGIVVQQNNLARQDYREEMQRIRIEHEQLESEHDTLKAQCMNAKGQDHTDCLARIHDLHERKEALHQRIVALQQQNGINRANWQAHHTVIRQVPAGTMSNQPGGMAPAPATTVTTPLNSQ